CQRNPVGIENGPSEVEVSYNSLGGLLGKSLVSQASFVVLPFPHFNTADASGIAFRLGGFVHCQDGSVLMDQHDREWKIVTEKVKVPADLFADLMCCHA
ncbi:MAG TPA: hypothetical protein VD811_07495, partial [Desulfuromonadales bacterium]|nr:hypothetical protein [Desulfuromonadales bacterium]